MKVLLETIVITSLMEIALEQWLLWHAYPVILGYE